MFFLKSRIPADSRSDQYAESLRAAVSGRTSLFFILKQASMTVEASMVLPLFIFFLAELLYVFDMIRLQSRMLQALNETGRQLCEYAFYTEYALEDISDAILSLSGEIVSDTISDQLEDLLDEETGFTEYGISLVLSETYVRTGVEEYLGETWLNHSCLYGGASSISYLQSQIMTENDIIDLVADYEVSPFLSIFGLDRFSMQTRYYGHAWTGYDVESNGETEEDENETIVYITPTGSVYHLSSDCTYLKPSTKAVSASEIDSLRSSDGSKYYPCEICQPTATGKLIITTDGNRYHSSTSCSAIKRTIIEVLLSEVEDTMQCCSRCGSE